MNTKKSIWGIVTGFFAAVMLLCPWCALNLFIENQWVSLLQVSGTLTELATWAEEGGIAFLGAMIVALVVAAVALLTTAGIILIVDLSGGMGNKRRRAAVLLHRVGMILALVFATATFVICIWVNVEAEMGLIVCGPAPILVVAAAILGMIMLRGSAPVSKYEPWRGGSIQRVPEKHTGTIAAPQERKIESLRSGTILREEKSGSSSWGTEGVVNRRGGMSEFRKAYPNYVSFSRNRSMRSLDYERYTAGDCLFSSGAYLFRVSRRYKQVGLHAEVGGSNIANVASGERVFVSGRSGSWFLCKYNDRYGWIRTDYLESLSVR